MTPSSIDGRNDVASISGEYRQSDSKLSLSKLVSILSATLNEWNIDVVLNFCVLIILFWRNVLINVVTYNFVSDTWRHSGLR